MIMSNKNNIIDHNVKNDSFSFESSIAYFSDFQNWNNHEDEMINVLINKANELNVHPRLCLFIDDELSDSLWNLENIIELTKLKSKEIDIIFYKLSNLEQIDLNVLAERLKDDLKFEYILVNNNYQDLKYKFINTNFFETLWKENAFLIGNYATKPLNSKLFNLIKDSEFDLFAEETSLSYLFSGIVVHGKKLGRTIGFPTANIIIDINNPLSYGAYAVKALVEGYEGEFKGMGCYWKNERDENVFETTIFDFDEDIYGKRMVIKPIQMIHKVKKVNGLEELIKMLNNDQKISIEILENYQ